MFMDMALLDRMRGVKVKCEGKPYCVMPVDPLATSRNESRPTPLQQPPQSDRAFISTRCPCSRHAPCNRTEIVDPMQLARSTCLDPKAVEPSRHYSQVRPLRLVSFRQTPYHLCFLDPDTFSNALFTLRKALCRLGEYTAL